MLTKKTIAAAALLTMAAAVPAPMAYAGCGASKCSAKKGCAANPCAAKKCNPCAAATKKCNPCNPCAAKKCNPCKPKS